MGTGVAQPQNDMSGNLGVAKFVFGGERKRSDKIPVFWGRLAVSFLDPIYRVHIVPQNAREYVRLHVWSYPVNGGVGLGLWTG